MLVPYDSVSNNEVKWLNRIVFSDYEFPSSNRLKKIRKLDNRLSNEVGWYIKENNSILSQVCYFIYEIKTLEGFTKVGVPMAVGTLPGYQRHGYGKLVMEKVHERMREQNCKYSLLSTSNRWLAHQWYKKMGYIDIAHLGIFYGSLDSVNNPSWSIRDFKDSDEAKLCKLYNEIHKNNLGIIKRPPNFVTLRHLWKDNQISIKILEDNKKMVGFANVVKGAFLNISELNVLNDYSELDWLRFLSTGETMINPSPHKCYPSYFGSDFRYNDGDAVMMIKDLDNNLSNNEILEQFGVNNHSFVAHSLDRY